MSQEDNVWRDYYQKTRGRAPRQLLLDALASFSDDDNSQKSAIDLGCGAGIESVVLLERGWNVLAIDGEPAAIQHLMEAISEQERSRLQTRVAKFKDVVLPAADLIHASLSLPFCEPEYFDTFWNKVATAVKPGGRFAGQFFGVRDSWADAPDMTFHTLDQVRALFEDFEIEHFHETDEDGNAVSGPKHNHMFTVIARKK